MDRILDNSNTDEETLSKRHMFLFIWWNRAKEKQESSKENIYCKETVANNQKESVDIFWEGRLWEFNTQSIVELKGGKNYLMSLSK